MRILMKPIQMIAAFTKDGKIYPRRYQMVGDDGDQITINIDKIILHTEEKIAGKPMIIYQCQSVINGYKMAYELKYNMDACKWFLFRM